MEATLMLLCADDETSNKRYLKDEQTWLMCCRHVMLQNPLIQAQPTLGIGIEFSEACLE